MSHFNENEETQLSTEELEKVVKDIYVEISKIEQESRHLSERKKELKEYAKKKAIDFGLLEKTAKELKKPKAERDKESYKLGLYLNILEGYDY